MNLIERLQATYFTDTDDPAKRVIDADDLFAAIMRLKSIRLAKLDQLRRADGFNIGISEIRSSREKLGWSQATLANIAGTNQQTVDRIERGETEHSRATASILDVLNRGLNSLAANDEHKRPGAEAEPPPER